MVSQYQRKIDGDDNDDQIDGDDDDIKKDNDDNNVDNQTYEDDSISQHMGQ